LLITLTPSSFTILYGQTLYLSHSVSFANSISTGGPYTVSWSCPGTLNAYCAGVTGDTLRLPFEQFAKSGLDYWKAHTIWMTASTPFVQGDGSRSSNQSVSVQWLDVNSDATLV
jgi:hypothetical protein